MAILELDSTVFDQILVENDFVVIEFGANWCSPCQAFQQVMLELQPRYTDFLFATVDIDKEPGLAEEFDIMSVPAVMIIRQGVIIYAESGAVSVTVFRDLLEQARNMS